MRTKGNFGRSRFTRLRMESLEPRRLLAFAGFGAELYRDVDGTPGEQITNNSVVAGATFFLRVTAQEFDPFTFGLQSVAVGIDWDAGLIEVVESDFDPESVITPNLPSYRTGELNNAAGYIEDLHGMALFVTDNSRSIGNAGPETFALIRMRAGDQAGAGTIQLRSTQTATIASPLMVLGQDDLNYASTSVVVTPDPRQTSFRSATLESEQAPEPTAPPASPPPASPPPASPPPASPVPASPVPASPVPSDEEAAPVDAADHDSGTDQVSDQAESTAAATSHAQPAAAAGLVAVRPDDAGHREAAESEDVAVTFDLNQDGIFDLADFGLLNVTAAAPEAVGEHVQSTPPTADDSAHAEVARALDVTLPQQCTPAPPATEVDAYEAWLDDFARAWLADADDRARRRLARFAA